MLVLIFFSLFIQTVYNVVNALLHSNVFLILYILYLTNSSRYVALFAESFAQH